MEIKQLPNMEHSEGSDQAFCFYGLIYSDLVLDTVITDKSRQKDYTRIMLVIFIRSR